MLPEPSSTSHTVGVTGEVLASPSAHVVEGAIVITGVVGAALPAPPIGTGELPKALAPAPPVPPLVAPFVGLPSRIGGRVSSLDEPQPIMHAASSAPASYRIVVGFPDRMDSRLPASRGRGYPQPFLRSY